MAAMGRPDRPSALTEEDAKAIADAFGGEVLRNSAQQPIGILRDGFSIDLSDEVTSSLFAEVARRAGPRPLNIEVEAAVIANSLFGTDAIRTAGDSGSVIFRCRDKSAVMHIDPEKNRPLWLKLLRLAEKV